MSNSSTASSVSSLSFGQFWKRYRRVLLFGLVGLLLLASIGGYWWWKQEESTTEDSLPVQPPNEAYNENSPGELTVVSRGESLFLDWSEWSTGEEEDGNVYVYITANQDEQILDVIEAYIAQGDPVFAPIGVAPTYEGIWLGEATGVEWYDFELPSHSVKELLKDSKQPTTDYQDPQEYEALRTFREKALQQEGLGLPEGAQLSLPENTVATSFSGREGYAYAYVVVVDDDGYSFPYGAELDEEEGPTKGFEIKLTGNDPVYEFD